MRVDVQKNYFGRLDTVSDVLMLCSELRESKHKSEKNTKSVGTFCEWAKRRCIENAQDKVYFPFLDLPTQVRSQVIIYYDTKLFWTQNFRPYKLPDQTSQTESHRSTTVNRQEEYEVDSLNGSFDNSRISETSNLTVLEEDTILCEVCEKGIHGQRVIYCRCCKSYYHTLCLKMTSEPELPWTCDLCIDWL